MQDDDLQVEKGCHQWRWYILQIRRVNQFIVQDMSRVLGLTCQVCKQVPTVQQQSTDTGCVDQANCKNPFVKHITTSPNPSTCHDDLCNQKRTN